VSDANAIVQQTVNEVGVIAFLAVQPDLTISYANQAAARLLGSTDLVGSSAVALVHPEELALMGQTVEDYQDGPRIAIPTIVHLRHAASAEYLPVECWIQAVFETGPVRFVLAMRDATTEDYLDRFVFAVQQNEPLDVALKWLVNALDARNPVSRHAILWSWSGERFAEGVSSKLDVETICGHPDVVDLIRASVHESGASDTVVQSLSEEPQVAVRTFDGETTKRLHTLTPRLSRESPLAPMCTIVVASLHDVPLGGGARRIADRMARFARLAIDHTDNAHRVLKDSLTDSLTHLENRRSICAHIDQWLAARVPGAIALIDLDGFKAINDGFGHTCGDEVLVLCADRLALAVGPRDHVGHLGGDEFAILLHGDAEEVSDTVERLHAVFERPVRVSGMMLPIGASMGVARLRPGVDTLESSLHRADERMYRMKRRRQIEEVDGSTSSGFPDESVAAMPPDRLAKLAAAVLSF
jgi:diguanylate cyclase (GGDEF)-like protein